MQTDSDKRWESTMATGLVIGLIIGVILGVLGALSLRSHQDRSGAVDRARLQAERDAALESAERERLQRVAERYLHRPGRSDVAGALRRLR